MEGYLRLHCERNGYGRGWGCAVGVAGAGVVGMVMASVAEWLWLPLRNFDAEMKVMLRKRSAKMKVMLRKRSAEMNGVAEMVRIGNNSGNCFYLVVVSGIHAALAIADMGRWCP